VGKKEITKYICHREDLNLREPSQIQVYWLHFWGSLQGVTVRLHALILLYTPSTFLPHFFYFYHSTLPYDNCATCCWRHADAHIIPVRSFDPYDRPSYIYQLSRSLFFGQYYFYATYLLSDRPPNNSRTTQIPCAETYRLLSSRQYFVTQGHDDLLSCLL
jgi:hypothetical protein